MSFKLFFRVLPVIFVTVSANADESSDKKLAYSDPRRDDPMRISVGGAYDYQGFSDGATGSMGLFKLNLDNMWQNGAIMRVKTELGFGKKSNGDGIFQGGLSVQAGIPKARWKIFDDSQETLSSPLNPGQIPSRVFLDGVVEFRGKLATQGASIVSFLPIMGVEVSDQKHNSYLMGGIGFYSQHLDDLNQLEGNMTSFLVRGAIGDDVLGAECELEWGGVHGIERNAKNVGGHGSYSSVTVGLKAKPIPQCTLRVQYVNNSSTYDIKNAVENGKAELRVGAEWNFNRAD